MTGACPRRTPPTDRPGPGGDAAATTGSESIAELREGQQPSRIALDQAPNPAGALSAGDWRLLDACGAQCGHQQ